jgi:trehalose-6-phosphate synthase
LARLVIVSNRVAVPSRDGGSRAGGLAVAIRSVLRRHPGVLAGRVMMVGVNRLDYSKGIALREMERQIGETAGRVNGAYGEASWTPIRYVNRAHSRTALVGLYRSARAALVTPLRDGMNLVAKEYVAAQDREDPGVLILSRFAGAAVECEAALLVNPYDPESVGNAIAQALSMPLEERCAHHGASFQVLAANDVESWGERFLIALTRPVNLPNWLGQSD